MFRPIRLKDYFFKRKFQKKAKYWREHPVEFCEEYMGCKLYPYQKVMVNMLSQFYAIKN